MALPRILPLRPLHNATSLPSQASYLPPPSPAQGHEIIVIPVCLPVEGRVGWVYMCQVHRHKHRLWRHNPTLGNGTSRRPVPRVSYRTPLAAP
ncbi:hypothetical protein JB92DRAFT_2875389 [Gautieria morchelliformis]|nr:hypothetical protein JB92DRAFT_2875389 [Gautieria morchelliformis]